MIDISKETLLTVKQARRELPNRPSINTVYRWFWKGVRGGIRLESIRIGGRVYTSKEACSRFIYASSEVRADETCNREKEAIRQAQEALELYGL